MKKTILDKNNKIQYEILNNFSHNINNGNHLKTPENILLADIKDSNENIRHKLLNENQEMRNTLVFFQTELKKIINEKKELFVILFNYVKIEIFF